MFNFIYIDLKDGTGGFLIVDTKEGKLIANNLLRNPKYILRKMK